MTDTSTQMPSWLSDGEKYGLIGLEVKTEGQIPQGAITPNFCVLTDAIFSIPPNWRDWLGSIRAGEIKHCNLFLFSKQASSTPEILDAENIRLKQLAWNFYVGLLLASTFAPAHRPVMLTGVRRNGEIDIRQQQDLDAPVPCIFRPYPPVLPSHIQVAAQLGEKLGALAMAPLPAGHWRLFRSLHVYTEARTTGDILDRLHQYSRCIDGLILPDAGRTRQQFRSRTELFIGPRHQGHPVLCTIPYS